MVTWDNFLRGITLIFLLQTYISFLLFFQWNPNNLSHCSGATMTWLDPTAPGFAFTLPSSVWSSGSLSLAELFLCHKLTTYSLHQWHSLSHQWMNRLPLSCHDSFLCPTSSHSESLRSLISLLWHLFTAALYCGYLCSKKRTKPQRRRLGVYPFSNIIARPFPFCECQVSLWSWYVPLHCFQWEVSWRMFPIPCVQESSLHFQ